MPPVDKGNRTPREESGRGGVLLMPELLHQWRRVPCERVRGWDFEGDKPPRPRFQCCPPWGVPAEALIDCTTQSTVLPINIEVGGPGGPPFHTGIPKLCFKLPPRVLS